VLDILLLLGSAAVVQCAEGKAQTPLVFEVQLKDGSTTKVYDLALTDGRGNSSYTARKGPITFKLQLVNIQQFTVQRTETGRYRFRAVLMDNEVVDFDGLDAGLVVGRARLAGQDAKFSANIYNELVEMRQVLETVGKPVTKIRLEMNLAKAAFYYGFWGGRAWCGGAEVDTASLGMADLLNGTGLGQEAPVDSMDEVFSRHDISYFNAERQFLLARRATGEEITASLKQLRAGYEAADGTLVRELRALSARPEDWPVPPPAAIGTEQAAAFRRDAITYFRLLGKQFTGTEPAISRRESATGRPK